MAGYILTMLGDRMEMGHSIEGRVPFLDHKLVELIASQPVNQKDSRHDGEICTARGSPRRDQRYRLSRQKHPFLSPPATLSPDDTFSSFVQDTLRGQAFRSMPFFDQSQVMGLLDRLPTMDVGARTANDQVVMHLVSMAVLHERLEMSTGSDAEAGAELSAAAL